MTAVNSLIDRFLWVGILLGLFAVILIILTQKYGSKQEKFSYSGDWTLIVDIDMYEGYAIYRNQITQQDVLIHTKDHDVVKYGHIGFFEEALEK